MKNSRFQLILIGVFVVLTLIGVGYFAFGGRGSGSGRTTVILWGTIPANQFTQIYSGSALSKNQTISVQYSEHPASTFNEDFVNALAEGRGPDLVLIGAGDVLKNKNKLLVVPFKNYSERTFKDTFAEEGELFLTQNGVIAFPITIDPLIMYWNRDTFTSAGIAQAPSFWDEFFKLSQTLTQKDGAFNLVKFTAPLGEYRNIENAKDILSALIMQAGNPIVSSQGGVATSVLREQFGMPTPPSEAALSFFTEFSNPAKTYYTWNRSLPNSQTAFISGDLAVYFGFASELPILKLKNPNLNFDISAFPQSSNVREGARKVTFGKIMAVAIVRNSKVAGQAFSTSLELSGAELSKSFAEKLSMAPARRDLLAKAPSDSAFSLIYENALVSRGWLDPDSLGTDKIFQDMIESVTGGRARVGNAVSQASLEIASLLNK